MKKWGRDAFDFLWMIDGVNMRMYERLVLNSVWVDEMGQEPKDQEESRGNKSKSGHTKDMVPKSGNSKDAKSDVEIKCIEKAERGRIEVWKLEANTLEDGETDGEEVKEMNSNNLVSVESSVLNSEIFFDSIFSSESPESLIHSVLGTFDKEIASKCPKSTSVAWDNICNQTSTRKFPPIKYNQVSLPNRHSLDNWMCPRCIGRVFSLWNRWRLAGCADAEWRPSPPFCPPKTIAHNTGCATLKH